MTMFDTDKIRGHLLNDAEYRAAYELGRQEGKREAEAEAKEDIEEAWERYDDLLEEIGGVWPG